MPSDPERPVRHLQGLYTVVVGVALAVAMTNLLDQEARVPVRLEVLPYLLAYLVTLVPFYHGALRHLDIAYLEDPDTAMKPGALLADWGLLFVEACLLLGLAVLIRRPEAFSYGLAALLVFDAVWAFAANLAFSAKQQRNRSEWRWALINLITAVLLILALVYLDTLDPAAQPVETFRWRALLTVAIGRTIWDYWWCWSFYYPTAKQAA